MKTQWMVKSGVAISLAGMLTLSISPVQADPVSSGACEETPATSERPMKPDAAKTFSGTVVRIDRMEAMHGVCLGVHITLKSGNQATRVHLAPCSYMKTHGMEIRKDDAVIVTGSYIDVCGNPELMASEITKDKKTLRLRDEHGLPLWTQPGATTRNKS